MGKEHVLVVEDHQLTAVALKQFLEVSGYRVDLAGTVARGLAATGSRQYDLLLCDLNLPDGTGWDLLEILQRDRPVRAVAFSAYDDPDHITRSRSAVFIDHIGKETDPDQVLERIRRAIKAPLQAKRGRRGRPANTKD